jgi:hypothetical protein
MSQFFFRKYRRTIGIIDKYLTLRFSHTRPPWHDRLHGIRLLQRLGFFVGHCVGKRLGVKYLLEKRQDRHEVMSTGSQSGYAAEMSNNPDS